MVLHMTTCRTCSAALTFRSHTYVDDSGSPRANGHRHMPQPMPTSDLLDLVYGDEGRDDALTTALRAAGN